MLSSFGVFSTGQFDEKERRKGEGLPFHTSPSADAP